MAASGRAAKRRAGRNGSAGWSCGASGITGNDGPEQATKIPEIAEICSPPNALIWATVADFCAVLAELHVESRQARRARLALPIPCHQRQESGNAPHAAALSQSPLWRGSPSNWQTRIFTGFLAFCTLATRVGQRLRGQGAQDSPGFRPVSTRAPVSEEQRRILSGILLVCTRNTQVPQRDFGSGRAPPPDLRRSRPLPWLPSVRTQLRAARNKPRRHGHAGR